uniref:Uncharacterized protein n=1 Tax=Vitis vinifera TaxID=29760 RepID=F6I4X3_VITVI
MPRLKLKLA